MRTMQTMALKNVVFRHPTRILAILITLAGLAFIGQGVWIKAKAALSQVLLDRAFSQARAGIESPKPWPWADITPMARIEATPGKSGGRVSNIALADTSGEALAFGPGHVPDTPPPGGEGTSVFSAHRDTHFDWLQHLSRDDEVKITDINGQQFTYRVTGTRIVRFDASGIDPHSMGRKLALTTCYPFGSRTSGPLRYVVEAELIEDREQAASQARWVALQ